MFTSPMKVLLMISIFKSTVTPSDRRVTVPKVEYIKQRANECLSRALDYYHFTKKAVPSDHLLVRLINSINLPITMRLEEYLWQVSDQAPELAKVLGIGSYVHVGEVKAKPTFYGPQCYELIQLRTGYCTLGQDWRTVKPLKVKVHSRTDLSLVPLDGTQYHDESGLVVIGLDLEALMYMYRGWYESERSLQTEKQTVRQFIDNWVLPSMLESHLDVAWFNRFTSLLFNRPVDPTVPVPSLALPDLTTYVSDVHNELLRRLTSGNFKLTDMLTVIPVLYNEDLYEMTRIDRAPRTISVKCYELLLQLTYLKPLLELDSRTTGRSNQSVYNEIRRELLRARNERWLSYLNLPSSMTALVSEYVNK